jgi:hypothetical protein
MLPACAASPQSVGFPKIAFTLGFLYIVFVLPIVFQLDKLEMSLPQCIVPGTDQLA